MLILYVTMKYDYGKPDQGYSFQHYNFYHSLLHMGHDILYFDFMTLMQEHGRGWMNRRLVEVARAEKPKFMFALLHRDEVSSAALRDISDNTDTITLNWFTDDHWRFDNFSRHWAPCFNWAVTTAESAVPKYEEIGYQNAIKSQWACNHFLYRKLDLPLEHDVTFVGQPHGNRRQIIQALRAAGISVRAWGSKWESGRLSQEEMIQVFNQSRINLNLSNASVPLSAPRYQLRSTARSLISRSLDLIPFGPRIKVEGKAWLSRRRTATIRKSSSPAGSRQKYLDQIKGRNFEVPGCGGFLLTGRVEGLEDYYEIGKEIVCFEDVDDLIEKTRYYLDHEDERAAIARSGCERTLREHTYVHRFNEIFRRIGLGREQSTVVDPRGQPGHTEEIR